MVLDGRPVPMRPEARARRAEGLPPHDVAAEEAVIAALLLDDDALDRVADMLRAEDFFRDHNGWIFSAATAVHDRGDVVTIPTVAHELDRMGLLDKAGGEPYLVDLAGKYFTAVGVEAHARIIARDALYRRMISAAGQIAQLAYQGGPDAEAALEDAESTLAAVRSGLAEGAVSSVGTLIDGFADDGDDAQRLSTGFTAIDRLTRGYKRGQVVVVGGRQDSGKSALMMSMAYRQANRYGTPVLYVPLEDTPEEVIVRLAGESLGMGWDFATKAARANAMSPAEWASFRADWPRALQAVKDLTDDRLVFPSQGRVPGNLKELVTAIRIARRRFGVQCVYVDYIDVLPKSYRKGQSTADVVSEQMTVLMNLAVKLDIAIVVGSQVSNEEAKTDRNPPKWTGLLDSGAKARNARGIIMVGLAPERDIQEYRRPMLAAVAKVKGYAVERMVTVRDGQGRPLTALYLDLRTGLIREVGD